MRKLSILISTLCFLFTFSFTQTAQAQTDGFDTLLERIQSIFDDDTFNLGLTMQSQVEVHWDPEFEGQNTFRIPTTRIKAYGTLSDNFRYFTQADLTANQPILDAILTFNTERFALSAGATKPTLSTEFLLGTNDTDFINRSRIVESLAQRRDIGLKAVYSLSPSLTFSGGMFNGTNQRLENSNNTFYYTGRLRFYRELDDNVFFSAAINAGVSEENGTQIGNGFLPAVNGNRAVYGGDFRLETERFLLSSELLFANLEYGPQQDDEVAGFHITGGYAVTPGTTLYLRLDHIESDVVDTAVEDQVVAAFSHNFSSVTNFQFNYLLNPDDFELSSQYWLAQVQLGF